jgi:DNA-binding transcriptional LysR family regulator
MRKNDVSTTSLRVLLTIVETGSFTRAAESLGMTQSGISQAVRSLESALHGSVLLSRGRSGVKLTALGEKVAGHARRILSHVDCIRQEASSAIGVRTGKVRIASVASAAARLLPASIRVFQRQYPKIEIVLVEGTDQEVRGWVLAGIVEIGFAALPQKGLTSRKIASDEVFLVVPKAHRLAGRSSASLVEIKDDSFLMSQSGCEPMIRSLFRSNGISPRVTLEVRDVSTLLALVREGVGVSLVPELAIPPGTRGISTISLEPRSARSLGVLLATGAPLSPAARAFLDTVPKLRT